jgi:L-fuculose-phosphate aldolase
MIFDLLHPADQIVMIMERIYGYGMTTTSGGNLSIREDNGEIWITPGGIDKGSLSREDIVHVMPDGRVHGNHRPSVELPFHQMIYARRPDLKAVIHAHPPALIAFSIVRKIPDTSLVPNMRLVCGAVGIAPYALPGSLALGENIAAVFGEGSNAVILENHGTVVGGADLFKAFMAFETLDFCARLDIEARRIGAPRGLSAKDIELSDHKQHLRMEEHPHRHSSSEERTARREMCELVRRACDQKLFTSTQGTFSQRLSARAFIITPFMVDRKYMEVDDLVHVEDGRRESGKTPSRSVLLHHYIYEAHPHVGSIIVAHPPHIMAFAVTEEGFDSRTIPESYIMLRKVARLPYGSTFMEPRKTAALFGRETPLALVQNDCVVVTGQTLIQAFDRLEVAEYSAKALIACRQLGEVVMIDPQRVREIEEAFMAG